MDASLRLHRIIPSSRANGPGDRVVVWLQGCTLGCPECFNPGTHSTAVGEVVSVDVAFERIMGASAGAQGLTITGGEPMQQAASLLQLLRRIREQTSLSAILFSGFSHAELRRHPQWPGVSSVIDVLIAGRYEHGQRVANGLLGSANKTMHCLTDRYTPSDLAAVPPAEVIVAADGEITLTGIDPLRW